MTCVGVGEGWRARITSRQQIWTTAERKSAIWWLSSGCLRIQDKRNGQSNDAYTWKSTGLRWYCLLQKCQAVPVRQQSELSVARRGVKVACTLQPATQKKFLSPTLRSLNSSFILYKDITDKISSITNPLDCVHHHRHHRRPVPHSSQEYPSIPSCQLSWLAAQEHGPSHELAQSGWRFSPKTPWTSVTS